jgi:glycosyltransferase involved in cell wall biosynthesis
MALLSDRSRIRIAFCHFTADNFGGSDFALWELVRHLPGDRYVPLVILRSGDPMAARYRNAGIPVVEFPLIPPSRSVFTPQFWKFMANVPYVVPQMVRLLRRESPDLVHVNTLFNLQGAVSASLAGVPLVWHVRELMPESVGYRVLVRLAVRLADRLVANSSAAAQPLSKAGGAPTVVLDAVDLQRFQTLHDKAKLRQKLGLPQERMLVISMGRIEPWKGQHLLVDAAALVRRRVPQVQFLILGQPAQNKPEYMKSLERRCRELRLDDTVRFIGFRHDIELWLQAADVFVLPTATIEPFGRVVPEAMAAALPVVVPKAGGPLEIVEEGITGFFYPPADVEAMAEVLVRVLHNPEESLAVGMRAREHALRRFSVERVVNEMQAVFESVLSAERAVSSSGVT